MIDICDFGGKPIKKDNGIRFEITLFFLIKINIEKYIYHAYYRIACIFYHHKKKTNNSQKQKNVVLVQDLTMTKTPQELYVDQLVLISATQPLEI